MIRNIMPAVLLVAGLFGSKISAQSCTGSGKQNITVHECSATASPSELPLRLYPNPAKGVFWVKNADAALSFDLFNMLGIRLLTRQLEAGAETEINTQGFPGGTYLICWKTESHRGTRLLVIENP